MNRAIHSSFSSSFYIRPATVLPLFELFLCGHFLLLLPTMLWIVD